MKTKKYSDGKIETFIIDEMEISHPFMPTLSDDNFMRGRVHIEIDLTKIVDAYDYHDFPNSVDLWLDESDIQDLHDLTKTFLKEIKALRPAKRSKK